jgi:hypothetical protein
MVYLPRIAEDFRGDRGGGIRHSFHHSDFLFDSRGVTRIGIPDNQFTVRNQRLFDTG